VFNTQRRRFASQRSTFSVRRSASNGCRQTGNALSRFQPNSALANWIRFLAWLGPRLHWEFICDRGQIFDYREHSQRQKPTNETSVKNLMGNYGATIVAMPSKVV